MENWFDMLVQSGLLIVLVGVAMKGLKLLGTLIDAKTAEIASNTQNVKLREYLLSAENSVKIGVLTVAQELGDALKDKAEDGKLSDKDKKDLKEMCIEKVTLMVGNEVKEAVTVLKGDFDIWLNNSIEAFIKESKTK
jgi:rRNA maturation endonuclease Nob1